MSSISFPASAASHSDLSEPECAPSHSARSNRSPAPSSPSTGLTCPAPTTSPPENSERAKPTSSAAASPARTSVLPGPAPVLPASVRDSGGSYFEPFAWYDRATQSWRTWQRCLVEGWGLFSETWPRSGMMRSGIAFRRPPLVPLTDATESGSWPTPMAVDGRRGNQPPRPWDTGVPLAQAVAMWPTPSARDWKGAPLSADTLPTNSRPLNEMVRARQWSTPTATRRGARKDPMSRRPGGGARDLANDVAAAGTPGALNPTWVEWLMGYPLGWTALKGSRRGSSGSWGIRSGGPP